MKDLLGGEERVDPEASYWADAFIVNLGIAGDEDVVAPGALQTWHVDSDFFVCISEPRFTAGSFQVHFFDSPKQALLVTLIFSKVVQRGGGTYTAPDGVGLIAHYLEVTRGILGRCFTEGIHLHFFHFYAQQSRGGPGILEAPGSGQQMLKIRRDDSEPGDVVISHPLMLHSVSKNILRTLRAISNPHVSLREPFNFNRTDPEEFSLVELKTLKELGVECFDFKPTTDTRRRIVPERVAKKCLKRRRSGSPPWTTRKTST